MRHRPFTHTYHPFSTNRSLRHLLPMAAIIAIPLVALVLFSSVAHIDLVTLFANLGISLGRIFSAFIISAIVGWLCAVSFYDEKRAKWAFPLFDVLQSFPTYAALPLAVVFWGVNDFVVVFFIALEIVWSIFFSINSSLNLVRHDWVEAVKLSKVSGWQYLKLFLIPITLPGLITGSIIGMGNGWQALVATEIIVGVKSGLGPFFSAFSHNAPITLIGIFSILAIIFAINKLIWLPLHEWSHQLMEE